VDDRLARPPDAALLRGPTREEEAAETPPHEPAR
jgi:hypothetical protein